MTAPRGYNRYRGRSPLWKKVVAVLLILVIVAAVAFMVLQDRVFYDDSGTPHLPRPAGQQAPSGSEPVDPGKPAARQYLCGIAKELADQGFDELLLTNVSYPTEGKIDKIDYGEALKPAALADFLREVRSAVGEDVTISVELPAQTILSGSDPVSGIVLADLAPLADRIYAVTDAASAPALEQAVRAACDTTEFAAEVTDTAGVEGGFLLTQ